jgi:hypothetical protein
MCFLDSEWHRIAKERLRAIVACSEKIACEANVCADVGRVGLQRDNDINGSHMLQATEILADTKNHVAP